MWDHKNSSQLTLFVVSSMSATNPCSRKNSRPRCKSSRTSSRRFFAERTHIRAKVSWQTESNWAWDRKISTSRRIRRSGSETSKAAPAQRTKIIANLRRRSRSIRLTVVRSQTQKAKRMGCSAHSWREQRGRFHELTELLGREICKWLAK